MGSSHAPFERDLKQFLCLHRKLHRKFVHNLLCITVDNQSHCLLRRDAALAAIEELVETVNELYDRGDTIIIYSARTWAEYEVTVDWLRRHGVKYHQLMLGKPVGDLWIDDRSVNPRDMGWDGIRKQLIDTKQ